MTNLSAGAPDHEPPHHGYLHGPLVIDDGLGRHDLREGVWSGPTRDSSPSLSVADHGAGYILIVEKKSVFNRLVADEFSATNPCVLATGDGYPATDFRKLLRRLHDELAIPLYILADNDPAGYLFFFLMSRGIARRNSRPKDAIAIPDARYLGLRAGDADQFRFPEEFRMRLSEREIKSLALLNSSAWLQQCPLWQLELDQLLRRGSKLEMEAACSLSYSFLADEYLPNRVVSGDWLLASS